MIKPSKPAPRIKPASPATPEGERLSKHVAHLMACSRREAEQYIEGGWVSVNGVLAEEPMLRVRDQTVTVDPHASLMLPTDVTLLLHKPPGFDTLATPAMASKRLQPAQLCLTPASHWPQDPSKQRILRRHFAKLQAAVPLEQAASGLVVFTQDWRVLRKLTEDAAFIEHELVVEVAGEVSAEALRALNGTWLERGQPLPLAKVSINSTLDTATRLRFVFKGPHTGLIAALCDRVNLSILSIKRLRIGRVALSNLPSGQWRYLQEGERF
ncbi:RNA pseudouridine synthase [Rhodoferax sp.]|uniref:RNA pseudouridine synthase n=1 Tax=Rhodoferax sp. TaxID=50421 RepID=UPI00261A1CB1|nr:RNA pseudouridine synthase [Rhodoferax sp.]MDD2809884.1 RNA pseudouridine synthase [Rhodoferax sp.]MDD4943965.1 RNA pseudouridine synthase [Rhodoferax sp.]